VSEENNVVKPVSLSEVKSILKRVEKDREELLYEQKIALEHAQKFVKINVKKTNKMVKELSNLEFLQEIHAYKIADVLPISEEDIKTIFAKERISLGENEIKNILNIVNKYIIE
jgi:DNA-directed RNA polymerase subunit F